jgi:hypothetical protein
MGFAALYPYYELPRERVDASRSRHRGAPPIPRTGCAALLAANRARAKIQLLASRHALLGSEHL